MNTVSAIVADTNVLDWSCTNNIAVALGNLVYSWNSESGKCRLVPLSLEDSTALVCSLVWAPNGTHLALGLDNGHILVSIFFFVFFQ